MRTPALIKRSAACDLLSGLAPTLSYHPSNSLLIPGLAAPRPQDVDQGNLLAVNAALESARERIDALERQLNNQQSYPGGGACRKRSRVRSATALRRIK